MSIVVEIYWFPCLPSLHVIQILPSVITQRRRLSGMGSTWSSLYWPVYEFYVAEQAVVGYDCHDPHTCHSDCSVIISLSSGVRCWVGHYSFDKFVNGCTFDLSAAQPAYRCSAEIDWSSIRLSSCWFLYTFTDCRLLQLSAAEVMSHKRSANGELAPPQMPAARVVPWDR